MITKKRDQRQYDLVQQYLPGLILNTILGIICELGDPYDEARSWRHDSVPADGHVDKQEQGGRMAPGRYAAMPPRPSLMTYGSPGSRIIPSIMSGMKLGRYCWTKSWCY